MLRSIFPGEVVVETKDPDRAASVLRNAAIPYSSELLPGSPSFSTRILVAEGQGAQFSRVVTTGTMRVKSRLPADSYALALDLGSGAGLHRGEEQSVVVNSESAFIQSPLQAVEVLTPPDFDVLFVKLARNSVVNELQKMLDREVRADLVFSQEFRMYSGAGQRLRELLLRLRGFLGPEDKSGNGELIRREVAGELITLLLQAQPHNYTRLLNRCDMADLRRLRVAEEFICANAHLAPSLGDVCAAAGASARTLQDSFQQKRGCSPMQFLRKIRMEKVRAGLMQPEADASVTNEAVRWGFLHFGRFSREYRNHFGELPSKTLQRSRRGPVRFSR